MIDGRKIRKNLLLKSNCSVDVQSLHEFFESVTSASQSSPAGWTSLNPGSAVSTYKVTLAALMDLGLSSELRKTNLNNNISRYDYDYYYHYRYRTLRNPALDTVSIGSPHHVQDFSQVSLPDFF